MKRKDLVRLFEKNGWWLLREGSNHTIYTNGKACEPMSRQTEIDEILAKKNNQTSGAEIVPLILRQ